MISEMVSSVKSSVYFIICRLTLSSIDIIHKSKFWSVCSIVVKWI